MDIAEHIVYLLSNLTHLEDRLRGDRLKLAKYISNLLHPIELVASEGGSNVIESQKTESGMTITMENLLNDFLEARCILHMI